MTPTPPIHPTPPITHTMPSAPVSSLTNPCPNGQGLSYASFPDTVLANITFLICSENGYRKPTEDTSLALAIGIPLGIAIPAILVILYLKCMRETNDPCWCIKRSSYSCCCKPRRTSPTPQEVKVYIPDMPPQADLSIKLTQVSLELCQEAFTDFKNGNLSWILRQELKRLHQKHSSDMKLFIDATEYTIIANYIRQLQTTKAIVIDLV